VHRQWKTTSSFPCCPPGPATAAWRSGVVLLSLALFLAAAPFAKLPLTPVPAFLPFYQSAMIITDALTALLLFGQARVARSGALLVLAAGLIHYSRGRITVLDRTQREARTCECYAVVKKEYDRLAAMTGLAD
jgi:hypothetical protein